VQGSCDLKGARSMQVYTQVEQVPQKEHSVICRNSSKEERTVEILRGDFVNHREPSDLTEVQGVMA
jgi:hypothetical protein